LEFEDWGLGLGVWELCRSAALLATGQGAAGTPGRASRCLTPGGLRFLGFGLRL